MLDAWKCAMCGGMRFPWVDHVCHDHKCDACADRTCNCILSAPSPTEIIAALNIKRAKLAERTP